MQSPAPLCRTPFRPAARRRIHVFLLALLLVPAAIAAAPPGIEVQSVSAATPGAAGTIAPTLALSFDPTSMTVAQRSILTVSLGNPNPVPAVMSADLSQTLPAGLQLESSQSTEHNCLLFTFTITNGGFFFQQGNEIPPQTTCHFRLRYVKAANPGSYTLTMPDGALQTDLGNSVGPASATLTVAGTGLSAAAAFDPPEVAAGASSRLTITFNNAGTFPADFSQPFTAFLPSDLESAAVPNATTTCAGGSASTTSDTAVLSAGASIPAGGSCTLAVDVASPRPGTYEQRIAAGAMQTTAGSNPQASAATLTISPGTGNAPAAALAPLAITLSTPANRRIDTSLAIANAAGSNPLTYSVAPRESGGAAAQAPWLSALPGDTIDFTLDDGGLEGLLGWTGGTRSLGSVWLNRFTAADAMNIDSISVFWPTTLPSGGQHSGLQIGMQPNLVVYYDASASGNPVNAVRVGSDQLVTIGALNAFETYATQFAIPGAGDVYIGFVDQWAVRVGGYEPRVLPVARDRTTPQQRSWISSTTNVNVVTNLVNLRSNGITASSAAIGTPGNWMIRATGSLVGNSGACAGLVPGWLSATPAEGWLNGGASTAIAVTADPLAASLAEGEYQANLCVSTNDAQHSLTPVPVTLTVTRAVCEVEDTVFCDGFQPIPPDEAGH